MFQHSLPHPSPWCLASQRYDVHQFPPRCLDCPSITLNPMRLSSISTSVRPKQQAAKFSPGLPHNQSCGCWRAGNQTVDVQLNASWVVSGLAFHADRMRWLRRFSVAASEDGVTFLDWGDYTPSNFTASVAVLFRYPIRATVLRLTIAEYVNHMVNVSAGFPLQINALVSNTEPFGCECTALPTGECCPVANMEVKNGTCVLCMDPSDIHTVMEDGCGRCKPGTVPFGSTRRCVVPPRRGSAVRRSLEVSNLESNRGSWSVQVDLGADVPVIVFISPDEMPRCSIMGLCLGSFFANESFIPVLWDVDLNQSKEGITVQTNQSTNQQYLQFDRGRPVLVMSEKAIRSWARCSGFQCVGVLGALFIDQFSVVDVIHRRLVYDLAAPLTNSLVCIFTRRLIPTTVGVILDADRYRLLFTSPELQNTPASVQWDDRPDRTEVAADGTMSLPPPTAWSSMRIFARGQQYYVAQPVPVVKRNAPLLSLQVAKESTSVSIAYGLALASSPASGDSEQLVTISAVSKQPLRLTKLASVAGGLSAVYTTSKGFISDPKRALDLVVACSGMMDADSMVRWLETAIGLIESRTESFVQSACGRVRSGEVSKLYWLVPAIPAGTKRTDVVKVSVEAIFV